MKTVVAIFFCFFPPLLFAQSLIFRPIALNQELPSKECYHVFQDPKGYLWIATELGLCRLDGHQLKIFDQHNGLPEKAIYAVNIHKGVIWLVSSQNRILTIKDGSLTEHPLSKHFQQMLGPKDVLSYAIHFNKNLIINTKWHTFELDTLALTVSKIPKLENKAMLVLEQGKLIPYNSYFPTPTQNIELRRNSKIASEHKINYIGPWSFRLMSCKNGDNYFFAYNDQLVEILPDLSTRTYQMPAQISCIYLDKQRDLWVGTYKNGLYYYPKANLKSRPISALTPYSIGTVFQDKEGSIWCTTLEKGTFIAKSKTVISYTNKLGDTYGQALLKHIGNHTLLLKDLNIQLIDSNGQLISSPASQTSKNSIEQKLIKSIQQHPLHLSSLRQYDFVQTNQYLYAIGYYYLNEIDGKKVSHYALSSPGRCIAQLDSNSLLLGCKDGIYRFEKKSKQLKKLLSISHPVTRILVDQSKKIFIATKGAGLGYMEGNKRIPIQLETDIVYDIAQDHLGNLWLGTNKGLVKMTGKHTTRYDVNQGLASNEVYQLAINNKKLYLLTSEGLSSISLTAALLNKSAIPVYLKSAKAGQHILNFNQAVQLKHYENSISLAFDMPSFKNTEKRLGYRLSPSQTTDRFTTEATINLENLAPANYQLTVWSINSDGYQSKPLQFNFSIAKPYWQTWWFVTALLLLIGLLLFLIFKAVLNRLKKREREKNRIHQLISESKLSAIQAQMNPHFVFNCINSIQKYILKRQERQAYDYLAQFSKLIRMTLQYSQEKNISLHQELDLLAIYISLEQLRFNHLFDYVIEFPPSFDTKSITIPAMLLQPYIENAIWHGISHLEQPQKGIITLKAETTREHLQITITDNGIGREAAMAYKRDNLHRPLAVKLNEQRLRLLNQLSEKPAFSVEFIDRFGLGGKPAGTTVVIYIPLNYGK